MFRDVLNRILHFFAFFLTGGFSIRPFLHKLRGVKIGKNVWIGQFVYIDQLYPEAVSIGENSTVGLRTTIFAHLYWGGKTKNDYGKVVIGKDVYIGPHCVILPNVHIGEGAVIKAGSIVSRNIPPRTFWGPPPAEALAKVTVPLTSEHSYHDFIDGLKPLRKKTKNNQDIEPRMNWEN